MARQQRLAPLEKQHESIRPYVRSMWNDLKEYGRTHSGLIEAEKARAAARGEKYYGHKMSGARGDLRDAFYKSRGRAIAGPKVKKERLRLLRVGTPESAAKVKKLFTNLHAVKYISGEPNHR